ncbi:MAG: hypothetical protein V4608_03670 [Bacteroidota bacterium]
MTIHKHINKVIIYIFICIYSFVLLKPVMPVVNDVLAHTFFKMQHLATVHYENGKHHLHVELLSGLDSQEKEPARNVPSSIYETFANHICVKTENLPTDFCSSVLHIPHKKQHIPDVIVKNSTPPPKA